MESRSRRKEYEVREAALLRWGHTLCGEPPPPMEASVPIFPPFQEAVHSIDPSHENVVKTESQTPCPQKGPKIEVDCATNSSTGTIVASVDSSVEGRHIDPDPHPPEDSSVGIAEGHHIDPDPHPPEDVLIGIDPLVAGVDSSVAVAEARHTDPEPHPPEDVDCDPPLAGVTVDGPVVDTMLTPSCYTVPMDVDGDGVNPHVTVFNM